MDNPVDRLFGEFDNGRISRRELLRALGVAALAIPAASFAQAGRDSTGRGRGNRPPADTTHAPAPFEATGWKTVWLDHITYRCTDYQKAAAFYSAVMSWKLRSDDGTRAVMDIGDDVGGIIMTNGYVAPPPPPRRDTTVGGGRGGGRGAGGGGGQRAPRTAGITNFCWGIDPWDTNKVEAALKARGLDPVADHAGSDFKSFHIKDPDGFDIQVSNGTKSNRRKGAATAALKAPLPFDPTGWNTVWLDHISYGCSDYKRTVAFYESLLSWKPGRFEGTQSQVDIGDIGGAIIRNRPGGMTSIDHISFGIEGFDPDKVEAELMKRGLGTPMRQDPNHLQPDTGNGSDIHTSKFK
ncbi:MAG TPA: VOC family protein, partial [Gemmatimonadaceae bacterium]|nr:VOC family protein [Gemmatimonadaceae bacterium]